jgi:methylphosphotriester-DNA--protein-cysteine methyltransferase
MPPLPELHRSRTNPTSSASRSWRWGTGLAPAGAVSSRLFETERATPADWIRRRRLERCRRDLLDPALWHTPVSTIAARWGFASPAHFSRAFRAAHGLPPTEYRTHFTESKSSPSGEGRQP